VAGCVRAWRAFVRGVLAWRSCVGGWANGPAVGCALGLMCVCVCVCFGV